MKKEVYQCLMQLESLSKIMRDLMDKEIVAAALNLNQKYQKIQVPLQSQEYQSY